MPTGPYAESILLGMDSINRDVCASVRPSDKPSRKRIRMSEAGYCQRRLGYKLLGAEQEANDTGTGLTFAIGNFVEEMLVLGVENAGLPVSNRQRIIEVDDPPMRGHIDGTVILDDIQTLLEIKSANERNFQLMMKKGIEAIYPSYYIQVQLYMRWLYFDIGPVDQTLFVVACKNYPDVYTEIIPLDEPFADDVYGKISRVWRAAQEGKLLEPEYHSSSKNCRYCPFRKECTGKSLKGKTPFIIT